MSTTTTSKQSQQLRIKSTLRLLFSTNQELCQIFIAPESLPARLLHCTRQGSTIQETTQNIQDTLLLLRWRNVLSEYTQLAPQVVRQQINRTGGDFLRTIPIVASKNFITSITT